MVVELLQGARALDAALSRKLGIPYHAILGMGLLTEIVRNLHEVGHLRRGRAFGSLPAIVLFGLLLLHQLAELAEHMDRRRRRA
jgi:hypothetical protein